MRILTGAMAIAGIVYGMVGLTYIWRESGSYGGVAPGMTLDEIGYAKGQATPDRADPATVHFAGGAAGFTVRLADARAVAIACEVEGDDKMDCPDAFGITPGASEADLFRRLGPPDRSALGAGGKEMFYDGLGFAFLMRSSTIVRVLHQQRGGLAPFLGDAWWQLVP